jgi:uncharacterized membrane protein YphA (DoxX/SURF4 family)
MGSIAQRPQSEAGAEVSGWRNLVAVACAVVLGILFIASGAWKLTDPFGWAARVVQLRFPPELSMPLTLGVGVAEMFSGVLIMVPRFRRWGAWLAGLLLLGFMVYMAVNYRALKGEDCSCFPWLERAVNPMFFITDALMLVAAAIAGWWARRSTSLRAAAIIAGALCVFAGVSYGVNLARLSGLKAPDLITVDGKATPLQYGKAFLYFFDPECAHCYEAAKKMSTYEWKPATKVIAVPTSQPQFAKGFLADTGFKAGISNDVDLLKQTFEVPSGPSAAILENGRQQERIIDFEGDSPAPLLRKHGLID